MNAAAFIGALKPRWTPLKLSGLTLWLDANNAASVLNSVAPESPAGSGQAVRCWKDLSGNGRHLEQTTGSAQPTVLTNWKNGCRALQFDGSDDWLTASVAPIPSDNGAQFTILFAAELQNPSGVGGFISQGHPSNGQADDDTFVLWRSSGSSIAYVRTTTSVTFPADTIAAVRSIRFTVTQLQIRRSGSSVANGTRNTADPPDVNTFSLGRWFAHVQMRFAELLIYNRALTDAELITAENYLRSKYGL